MVKRKVSQGRSKWWVPKEHTDCSALCWKCTIMMVERAKRDVPARAIFEPREAIVAEEVIQWKGNRGELWKAITSF